MQIGIPKEIKDNEQRVSLTPAGARELIACGHHVIVEHDAGRAVGLADQDYAAVGVQIVDSAEAVFSKADMVLKVKEPQAEECRQLRPEQTLLTYLHLAADPVQAQLLLASGATCIAYETITGADEPLPLLTPMSSIAGRLAMQKAAYFLEGTNGGPGLLCGGIAGVAPAHVVIIGGGTVGLHAARTAVGLGAQVTIIERQLSVLRTIDSLFKGRVDTLFSTTESIEQQLRSADVVIGAVLIPGAQAPKIITRALLQLMKPGALLIDVAIDQGGCCETSKPTTHQHPTFVVDGITHYCVTNMPSSVARTATFALTQATLPYILALANQGVKEALLSDSHLMQGLNLYRGKVSYQAVAEALDYDYTESHGALTKHANTHR